jgi:pimeloyl-ACP methyl ester carboxylesterase
VVVWLASSFAVAWWLTHRKGTRFDEPLPAELVGRAESFRLATRDAEEAIAGIPHDVPVLLLGGARDRQATPDDERELLARVADHAQLVLLDDTDHDRLIARQPAAYARAVLDFVSTVEQTRR